MSRQARVDSFSELRQFRASLATFASVAAVALDEAGSDIQRTLLWLREDRYRYWKAQVYTRTEQYTRAKLALKQREVLERAVAGTRSSCVEERRALQIAERRLRKAEDTFRLVRTYSRQIERESLDYKGATHGLVNAIDTEIANACASLDRMVDSLQRYVAIAPPEMPGAAMEKINVAQPPPAGIPTEGEATTRQLPIPPAVDESAETAEENEEEPKAEND